MNGINAGQSSSIAPWIQRGQGRGTGSDQWGCHVTDAELYGVYIIILLRFRPTMSEPCAPPIHHSATECQCLWKPSVATFSWIWSPVSLVSTSSTLCSPYVPLPSGCFFSRFNYPWGLPDAFLPPVV